MRFFSLRATSRAVVAVVIVLGLSALAFVSGCQQGIGQRCQVQADCDSGLICVIPPGMSPQVGGVCQSATTNNDAAVGDLAVTHDLNATSSDL